ncbi:MAG: glycosyltransferase family 4 protein [Nitrospirae bacterium]|nr:MAG: glycosyltransferase family 4 protein [Nitrospirota bacterium]
MRIAQVSPLYESVPPKLYGGTERVVSYLTEELVKMGHEVTLFASADSETSARLISVCPSALRLSRDVIDPLAHHVLMLEKVIQHINEFDIIHFHIDYIHFPLVRSKRLRSLTTLHGRLDIGDILPLYSEFREMPVVSISNAQRKPLPFLNWVDTVYHGIPAELYKPRYETGKYLAFIGRMSPEKRPDLAIEIAKRAGIPLKIAAKVDDANREYFERVVKPLLDTELVEFIGEIGEAEKNEFLGNALAMLFPIDWPEPFGLVMIEAMACGTPVIARRCGSVPEVMKDGVSGFIFNEVDEAVGLIERVNEIDRRGVRRYFEERFTSERMARDYVRLYNAQMETLMKVA